MTNYSKSNLKIEFFDLTIEFLFASILNIYSQVKLSFLNKLNYYNRGSGDWMPDINLRWLPAPPWLRYFGEFAANKATKSTLA